MSYRQTGARASALISLAERGHVASWQQGRLGNVVHVLGREWGMGGGWEWSLPLEGWGCRAWEPGSLRRGRWGLGWLPHQGL